MRNGRRIVLHNLCPYAPSARNLAPILRTDASNLLAITFSESQVTEIDFQAAARNAACRKSSTNAPSSRASSDEDAGTTMNAGHHQHSN